MIFDIETTGLNSQVDRIVEVGAVEIINLVPTGKSFQFYCNPEFPVPAEVVRIHGLTAEFLKDFPNFSAQVDGLLAFIGESPLVIHNAEFDMGFLNAELRRCNRSPYPASRAECTLIQARKKFPGSPASLNDLCRRFGISLEGRTLHGALLDSELLAAVYLELHGGRQTNLSLDSEAASRRQQEFQTDESQPLTISLQSRSPRMYPPTAAEELAHAAAIAKLDKSVSNEQKNPDAASLWTQINRRNLANS
ncbi:MAG: DNA polymerase III subunit epsilon [Alphaproteobacteria bacterium]|nr:DNA polymerase III subunit epsilon [Alphaproteobacteria bacterium]